ncbi:MAG: DUF368 domain-containing protein [Chlamydiia bacterium]|nr:DUF368 domain-containing protein [Chlamydiia bacterium]
MSDETPRVQGWRHALLLLCCGFCMGMADLVPGVSGGTMAFITGIYEDLLRSIRSVDGAFFRNLLCLRWRTAFRGIAWGYLVAVGFGALLAMASLAHVVLYLLAEPVSRTYLFASFLGLIAGSIYFCTRRVSRWTTLEGVSLVLGFAIALGVTSVKVPGPKAGTGYDVFIPKVEGVELTAHPISNYDVQRKMLTGVDDKELAAMWARRVIDAETPVQRSSDGVMGTASDFVRPQPTWIIDPWLALCGMIAISAMLLPGISGSYLLTILGVYPLVIGAFADLSNSLRTFDLDWEALKVISSVAAGIVLGLAVFSRFITWLLSYHHDRAVALLIGFMLGALRAVWPFWSYASVLSPLKLSKGIQLLPLEAIWPGLSSPTVLFAAAIACASCGVVLLLELVALKLERA